MPQPLRINQRCATSKLRADYAHIGLFDTAAHALWIARKRFSAAPIRMAHAQLLRGGSDSASVAEKDRFLCYWFHTPGAGEGPVHGYPIEWAEGHLMVRLDPQWDYRAQTLLRSTDERRIEKNISRQFHWGRRIFAAYTALRPAFPLSWHLLGPRPADSMFYVDRHEPA